MAVIAFYVQMPQGFPRMELFLLWGIVMFAIALHGGGLCRSTARSARNFRAPHRVGALPTGR